MEYVIPAVIVLLLIAGFVTFLVLNATKKSGPVADRPDEGPPGIGQDERTPLGDTSEHAGDVGGPREGEGRQRFRSEDEQDERPRSERLANRDA